MKNLITILKLLIFPLLLISFNTSLYAIELDRDTFDSTTDGWGPVNTGDQVYQENGQLRINRDDYAGKTYTFPAYADQIVTFTLSATELGGYGNNDDLEIRVDGNLVFDAGINNTETITFNATLNPSGAVTISIGPNTNNDNEDIYIDNIIITDYTPPAVETCPGDVIPNLDGTAVAATDNFDNVDIDDNKDHYYYFTPTVSGTFDVQVDTNRDNYVLSVYDGCNGTLLGRDNTNNRDDKYVTGTAVTANQTIVVRVDRNSNNNMEYDIDFTFSIPDPAETCPGAVIPNLDGTAVTAIDNFDNVNIDDNKDHYYYFTPTASGTFDVEVDTNRDNYVLSVYDGCNGTLLGRDNTNNRDDKYVTGITVPANQLIVVRVDRNSNNNMEYDIDFTYTVAVPAAPVLDPVSNQTTQVGSAFTYTVTATDPNNDPITYSASGLPAGLTINSSTGEISGTTTTAGTYTVTVTATDPGSLSDSDTFDITVSNPPLVATNNSYSITPGASITGNFITDDTGSGVDSGINIVASTSASTGPTQGTVSILPDGTFTYIPDSASVVSDSFTYTITDDVVPSRTSTATVTITITVQETSGGELPFYLINPDNTRNVIGNYAIAGNTVLCLTENTEGYGGTCHGDTDYQFVTSNNHVVKYLDIDNDNRTWNSTSSNITFPSSFDTSGGVLWAGLFWGGRISADNGHQIRYAIESGSTFTTVETGQGDNPDVDVDDIDLIAFGANDIKLKVDTGTYNEVSAATFHVFESSGGKTYAAYADVTSSVNAINTGGTHTFTVANLTTMEGREGSPGAFGGWSLVVIYAEDPNLGKPRNISIYNGFVSIDTDNDPISISGFKLPKTGTVDAQLSIFSGEGEHLYGRTTTSNNQDWLKINDSETGTYEYVETTTGTGVGNQNNTFNAQLVGIERDTIAGEYNDLAINNVGVDIDNWDVSSLLEGYRTNNQDINEIFIQTYSDNDYITSSMVAYSAELYVPELCYDYTLDIAGYVLTSEDNEINTPFGGFGIPLTTRIFLESLEGDIDLKDVNVTYSINDTTQVAYTYPPTCTTEISETGNFDYADACAYTVNQSVSGFDMYIGAGKTPTSGGIIAANQRRYLVWDANFLKSNINTSFNFGVNYTVNYGSGAVPLEKQFTSADLCDANDTLGGYYPELGFFNVVDINAPDHNQYNLYTQVSQRPFQLTVYAYDATTPTNLISNDLNLTVEVEMIRADNFYRDAETACNDEYSILSEVPAIFTHFDGKSANIHYDTPADINLAYRSVAMRIWYLTDVGGNGNLVDNHNCTRDFANKSECENLYAQEYSGTDTACSAICSTGAAWTALDNCYSCLRTNYGRKVCSRDNFAIRPESFITEIIDSNQSQNIDDPSLSIANSASVPPPPEFSVIAGYKYRFDINATNHQNDTATPRYIQHFDPGAATHQVKMVPIPSFKANTACNDVEDKNISINLFNGTDINPIARTSYIDEVDQIGEYSFEIFDRDWTSADWDIDEMGHHTDNAAYYTSGADCADSSTVLAAYTNGQNGCEISSVHTNANTGSVYNYLFAQFYPYSFNFSGGNGLAPLTAFSGPMGTNNFVYINSPGALDQNMSYNIQGTFYASGKNTDQNLSNFVDNCYAEDVNMSLYQRFLHPVPDTNNEPSATPTPFLTYDLFDFNTTRLREQNTFNFANDDSTAFPLAPLVVVQNEEDFVKAMGGTISMDLGYNFNRRFDTVLNPRLIQMNDFNLTYTISPADVRVDLETDYKIHGNMTLDQNVSFFYGRSKPGKFFYDDILTATINTPITLLAHCDLGFAVCQNRGIQSAFAQTNEAEWWLSLDHSTNILDNHGDVVLTVGAITEGAGSPTVTPASPTPLTIITNATDDTVVVSRGANPTLPMTVEIDFDTDTTLARFTDNWLIYNESDNSVPSPFYRVRFIGQSDWAGHGDTGFVVDGNVSIKKNRRLGW